MRTKFYLFFIGFFFSLGLMAQSYNSMLVESWTNNAWKNSMRMTYTFDSKGNVAQVQGDTWTTTNTWVKSTLTAYTLNSNSTVNYTVTSIWNNNQWTESQKTLYTYDANKNVLTIKTQMFLGAIWMDLSLTTNTYNGSGQLIKDVDQTLDYMTMQMKNSSQTTYTYNSDGTEAQNISQMWSGTSWENSSRYTYSYNSSKELTTTLEETYSSGSWVNRSKDTYSYNKSLNIQNGTAASQIKEILSQNWDIAGSKWVDASKDSYAYNSAGALTQILSQNWTNNAWVNDTRITFDPKTSVPQIVAGINTVKIYPNPFISSVTVENSTPSESEIYIYNTDGQMVKSFLKQQAVSRINLSDLSRGTYMVRVTTPGAEQVIKLLKAE